MKPTAIATPNIKITTNIGKWGSDFQICYTVCVLFSTKIHEPCKEIRKYGPFIGNYPQRSPNTGLTRQSLEIIKVCKKLN